MNFSWLTTAVFLIAVAACRAPDEEGLQASADVAPCEIAPRLIAQLGSLNDSVSIASSTGTSVEVRQLGDGGWIVVGGPPYLETPLQYDAQGRLVGAIGRSGDGPGEFRVPWALARGPNDSIWVSDRTGRIVIVDPSGRPSRTIVAPEGPGVTDFTPAGTPYGTGARRSTMTDGFYPMVKMYSKEGELTSLIGPGGSDPAADSYMTQVPSGRMIMISETDAIAGFGPKEGTFSGTDDPVWLARWSPEGQTPLLMKSDVLAQLVEDFEIPASHHLRNIAIRAVGDGRILNLAAIGEYPAGEVINSIFFAIDATDANAAYDGVIALLDDGEVVAAASFPDAPIGFAGENQFYSMVVDPATGISTIRIWEFSRSCLSAH